MGGRMGGEECKRGGGGQYGGVGVEWGVECKRGGGGAG